MTTPSVAARPTVSGADARRLFELTEPICLVTFFAEEPNDALAALGLRDNYWDGYFAGRAAPLGLVPAEVVHAAFYSFAPAEVARHLPRVWEVTTPEAATEARTRGSGAALRRILGELADTPEVVTAADLLTQAAASAPTEGRVMYAALRRLPVPTDPLERLWHAANTLREHRGDGHVAALLTHGIGRTEAHVLLALDIGMPAERFGRLHHLPPAHLDAVVDGLRARGLVTPDGTFTALGRETKASIELLTDELAVPPYLGLAPADLDRLLAALEPIAAALTAAGSR